ncbi:hypothetical protein HanRHA438_Chr17g0802321 [Helianthus annuus]|nr:hypothetical protein HanRHA438_Chr17g0802321 [Helianthus annuus]
MAGHLSRRLEMFPDGLSHLTLFSRLHQLEPDKTFVVRIQNGLYDFKTFCTTLRHFISNLRRFFFYFNTFVAFI